MIDSIQPDNRSALQIAIEQALDELVGNVDAFAPFPNLFDGLTTPLQFLPSLAIERGVADWSATDSEQIRRNTTAMALPLQSLSCTDAGLKQAVNDLGLSCKIRRLRPYVIEIEAGLESGSLTDELSYRVLHRVAAYKAARDSSFISLVRDTEVAIGFGIYAETGIISDCDPFKSQLVVSVFYPAMAIQAETYIISDNEVYRD
ncbi:phage tail protein I [Edwardsiella piscicida]|uniref:phage tail protein I n=1 Tax=Edwardsiella TaxID=635 RepID=UPI0002C09D42|nr:MULTISPECIES: phage tail protein I [Edwardsiella]AGH74031.1 phage tail protein I [Edwardsiella piscicida C07-087]EKS7783449.1 phage tail protein I [Edwardsiella piscicida]UCQ33275.1 phage tail protein I [Edwardsiella piscicida]WHQ15468.1 phage tail protein I [Edwardsiella anguillarum]